MLNGVVTRKYALLLKSGAAVQVLMPRIPNLAFQNSNRILEKASFPGLFTRLNTSLEPMLCKLVNDPTPQLEGLTTFDYGTTDWKKTILADFDSAQVIIICPLSLSAGLWWEVNTLLEQKHFWKVFFVVPDEADAGELYPMKDLWRQSIVELRKLKIVLPHRMPPPGLVCESRPMNYDLPIPWHYVSDELLEALASSRRVGTFHSRLAELGVPMLPMRSLSEARRSDA